MYPKKRQRISKACTFCKRRKIKCDMKQPCSSCVRYGCLDCVYPKDILESEKNEQHSAMQFDKIKEEIAILESRLTRLKTSISKDEDNSDEDSETVNFIPTKDNSKGLISNSKDRINFHDGYFNKEMENVRLTGKGPLSWFSLMKIDYNLNKAWLYLARNGDVQNIYDIFERNLNSKEAQSSEKIKYPSSDENYIFTELEKIGNPLELRGHEFSTSPDLLLRRKISSFLPDERKIILLVERFFSHAYKSFPLLDESRFRERLKHLLTNDFTIQIENKSDFAHLGITLVVLRFAYLSYFSGSGDIHDCQEQEFAETLTYQISPDAIKLARNCLDQFDLGNNNNLEVFQLAFFLRIYKGCAPEEGDGADSGNYSIFLSTLFDMAYALGLERDPNSYHFTQRDNNEEELRRRLWFLLIITDMNNSMEIGSPLNSSRFTFDTKPPVVPDTPEGNFTASYKHLTNMFEIMVAITDVNGINIVDLLQKIHLLEEKFLNYDTVSKIIKSDQERPFMVTLKLKVFLNGVSFLITLYFHIYIFFERKADFKTSGDFLERLLLLINDVMLCSHDVIEDSHLIFKDSTDLVIIPKMLLSVHKSLVVLSAFSTRLSLKSRYEEDKAIANENLTAMNTLLKKCYVSLLQDIGVLSKRYFYASVIATTQQLIWRAINSNQFYATVLNDDSHSVVAFPMDNLNKITNVLQGSLEKVNRLDSGIVSTYSSSSAPTTIDASLLTPFEEFDFTRLFNSPSSWNMPPNDYHDAFMNQFEPMFENIKSFTSNTMDNPVYDENSMVNEFINVNEDSKDTSNLKFTSFLE